MVSTKHQACLSPLPLKSAVFTQLKLLISGANLIPTFHGLARNPQHEKELE
jgi:hypothetical protein